MMRYFFLLLTFIICSCDPGVDLQTIAIDQLYSVNAFISPQDSSHRVYLFRASELGQEANTENAVVKGAQVVLSDGVQSDTLLLKASEGYYETVTTHVKVEALATYYLTVTIEGAALLTASCTVPPAPEKPVLTGAKNNNNYDFRIQWSNPAGYPYFVVSAGAEGVYMEDTPKGQFESPLRANLEDASFPSDKQQAENVKAGSVRNAFLASDPKVTGIVWHVDKTLFDYFTTWRNYDEWDVNTSEAVPNFREPSPIYTNIKNGVGVFGATNRTSITIDIE